MEEDLKSRIIDLFQPSDGAVVGAIPGDLLIAWMASEDLEIQGVLDSYLSSHKYRHLVTPPIQEALLQAFRKRYLIRCLVEDQGSDWVWSRYEAAWDLAACFMVAWAGGAATRPRVDELKTCLEDLYKSSDEDIRTAIVNGVLEHLFEKPEVARYFADWQENPELCPAYRAALQWRAGWSDLSGT